MKGRRMEGWEVCEAPHEAVVKGRALEAIGELSAAYRRGEHERGQDLREIVRAALEALAGMAGNGDRRAMAAFVAALTEGVRGAYGLQHEQPEVSREVAARTTCWPGFLTVDPDWRAWNEGMPELLGLGQAVPINFSGKTWTRRTPEVRIALLLLTRMEEARRVRRGKAGVWWVPPHFPKDVRRRVRALRPFSRESYAAWWKVAEPVFMKTYGANFEDRKEFAHYWRNAAYRGEKNPRALIRRDIKAKIKQAFRSVARRVAGGRKVSKAKQERMKAITVGR